MSNQPDTRCTVVVSSCDKYADLLPFFSALWKKFWPDCPFPIVLVTETEPEEKGVFSRVIACGPGLTWGVRVHRALGMIDTPVVMMLCDDYFLSEPVDTKRILARLDDFFRYNAVDLRLLPNPKPSLPFASDPTLGEYKKNTAYCIATQTGFWDRAFLSRLTENIASIWEFERFGSYNVADAARPLLATLEKEFPFVDAVHKGYWETFGVAVCEQNGLPIADSPRTLPPFRIRLRESLKALVFRLVSPNWIVPLQNAFGLGATEKKPVKKA